jgi:hypothetical protein
MTGIPICCQSQNGAMAFTFADPAAQQSDCLAKNACNWLDPTNITAEGGVAGRVQIQVDFFNPEQVNCCACFGKYIN